MPCYVTLWWLYSYAVIEYCDIVKLIKIKNNFLFSNMVKTVALLCDNPFLYRPLTKKFAKKSLVSHMEYVVL